MPKVEDFYSFPYGGKEYIMPMSKDGVPNKMQKTQIGGGSGFIISKDGYVVTSNHVVADTTADYTVILSPKHKYPAKVLSRNPINDIAILKIEGQGLPYIELADSSKIQLGEDVVAVGTPLGEFHDTTSSPSCILLESANSI
ncbi:MAG: hypothetical protein A3D35_03410 [Candidatus Staskawiczbacteria bacterium RIFCSPHIGHO2_02_FULL_34_9]|uniref:Serine protease n=1 Tax=Candidatus Staskawiczbacteria bacterium RIFCSPHIGHO2_02_FULL_34_9 TaxID=1802206 RepID=A0A1G2I3K9_9BACT|nr:MAG: hypothetical protein A3D35_03410 [Candidatus Staskawiczbacteria bacterium RIFCSPHIGHO2_02_FULL_34_9]